MKKILVLCLLVVSTFAETSYVKEVTLINKNIVDSFGLWSSTAYIYTYCIDGYVWQRYSQGRAGNLVQVFENKTYKINDKTLIISKVKTCQ